MERFFNVRNRQPSIRCGNGFQFASGCMLRCAAFIGVDMGIGGTDDSVIGTCHGLDGQHIGTGCERRRRHGPDSGRA